MICAPGKVDRVAHAQLWDLHPAAVAEVAIWLQFCKE